METVDVGFPVTELCPMETVDWDAKMDDGWLSEDDRNTEVEGDVDTLTDELDIELENSNEVLGDAETAVNRRRMSKNVVLANI